MVATVFMRPSEGEEDGFKSSSHLIGGGEVYSDREATPKKSLNRLSHPHPSIFMLGGKQHGREPYHTSMILTHRLLPNMIT